MARRRHDIVSAYILFRLRANPERFGKFVMSLGPSSRGTLGTHIGKCLSLMAMVSVTVTMLLTRSFAPFVIQRPVYEKQDASPKSRAVLCAVSWSLALKAKIAGKVHSVSSRSRDRKDLLSLKHGSFSAGQAFSFDPSWFLAPAPTLTSHALGCVSRERHASYQMTRGWPKVYTLPGPVPSGHCPVRAHCAHGCVSTLTSSLRCAKWQLRRLCSWLAVASSLSALYWLCRLEMCCALIAHDGSLSSFQCAASTAETRVTPINALS